MALEYGTLIPSRPLNGGGEYSVSIILNLYYCRVTVLRVADNEPERRQALRVGGVLLSSQVCDSVSRV